MDCSTPGTPSFTIFWSLCKFMAIESVMPSNHLIPCCPLLLLPSIFSASGSFPMSQLFVLGGQNIGASTSASVLPVNIQDWFISWSIVALQCCESAICIHTPPPSWSSFSPHPQSHSCRSSQSTKLSSLGSTGASHQLFYTWYCIYINPYLPHVSTGLFSTSASLFLPCK